MSQQTEFLPKLTPRVVGKYSDQPWLNFEEPQVNLLQGMRGSGKGVAVDNIVQKLYNEGFSIWHIWAARSFENLYYIVNKNCREKYSNLKIIVNAFYEKNFLSLKQRCECKGLRKQYFEKYLEIAIQSGLVKKDYQGKHVVTEKGHEFHTNKFLHCNCHKAYPIVLMVPNHIEFDQNSLDRFNGAFWKDLEEYKKYLKEITTEEKELLNKGELKKPEYLRPKRLIVVKQFTPPTSTQRKEVFREEFTKISLDARKEHRIIVMNPAFFQGTLDKFETITEIFKLIPYLMNASGHFSPLTENIVGKERKYWTKKQKSWHKVAIVINELRSVAPSSQLSGEKDAGKSKKAIFDYIPEARHYRTWFIGDYQRPDDLYPTVRYNASVVVIKNASRNILGADWNWLFSAVENWQIKVVSRRLHQDIKNVEHLNYFKNRKPNLRMFLDSIKPMIPELKANEGYVTFPNNEYKLVKFELPSFHHKQSVDDFRSDTGLNWSVNLKKKPEEPKTLTKTEKKKSAEMKRKLRLDIMLKMHYMKETEGKNWIQIMNEIVEQEKDGIIPNMGFATKSPKYFANEYSKWKLKKEQLENPS